VFRLLKTTFNGTIRLITQPDHAAVSGYMAAHWGNEEFSKLGYFDDSSEPEQLAAYQDAIIFGEKLVNVNFIRFR